MDRQELQRALNWSWGILSVVVLGLLVAPFVVPHPRLAAAAPRCEARARYGRECSLCGMTTAFLAISRAQFGRAHAANRGSLPLYSVLLANQVCWWIFLRRRWRCPY